MMRFANILKQVYTEPWLIDPETHHQICQIVQDHISGAAHDPGGRLEEFRAQAEERQAKSDDRLTWIMSIQSNIAVIDVSGVIGHRLGMFAEMSGAIGTETVERSIDLALENPDVEGILLIVDSPGGTVTNVPELADKISSAKFEKPLVAFTSSMMCSAGYWIASGADMIVATGSSCVGSIGVYSAFIDQSRAFEMQGLKTEVFKTGKFKGMGMPGLPLTEDQRELMQDRVDEIFVDFTASVIFNRDVENSALQGQSFSGNEAKKLGLVDVIGGVDVAISELEAIIQARMNES